MPGVWTSLGSGGRGELGGQSFECVVKVGEVDRLHQVFLESGGAGLGDVLFHSVAGDRDAVEVVEILELSHQVEAGGVGEAEIGDDQVILVFRGGGQCG